MICYPFVIKSQAESERQNPLGYLALGRNIHYNNQAKLPPRLEDGQNLYYLNQEIKVSKQTLDFRPAMFPKNDGFKLVSQPRRYLAHYPIFDGNCVYQASYPAQANPENSDYQLAVKIKLLGKINSLDFIKQSFPELNPGLDRTIELWRQAKVDPDQAQLNKPKRLKTTTLLEWKSQAQSSGLLPRQAGRPAWQAATKEILGRQNRIWQLAEAEASWRCLFAPFHLYCLGQLAFPKGAVSARLRRIWALGWLEFIFADHLGAEDNQLDTASLSKSWLEQLA